MSDSPPIKKKSAKATVTRNLALPGLEILAPTPSGVTVSKIINVDGSFTGGGKGNLKVFDSKSNLLAGPVSFTVSNSAFSQTITVSTPGTNPHKVLVTVSGGDDFVNVNIDPTIPVGGGNGDVD